MTEEIKAKAAAMFAEGASINQVAERLLKDYWAGAKKLHTAWLAETGGSVPAKKKPGRGPAKVREAEPESDVEAFELTVQVPVSRVDQIFAALPVQEKMDAIQAVMQARLNGE